MQYGLSTHISHAAAVHQLHNIDIELTHLDNIKNI